MRRAIYAARQHLDQEPENQLAELRRYVERGAGQRPSTSEIGGISGAKDRRPALDLLVTDASTAPVRRPRCVGDSTVWPESRHLITLLEECQALGVAFVSLAEGINATTPAGKASNAHSRRHRRV